MAERDLIIPMLIATGHHLKRIEHKLGLKKMTAKERALYMQVEADEVPHFKRLLRQGKGIMQGGGFLDFFSDAIGDIAGTFIPGGDKIARRLIGGDGEVHGEQSHPAMHGEGFLDDVWDGVKSVASHVAPVAIPLATKALLGASYEVGGQDMQRGSKKINQITRDKASAYHDINSQDFKLGSVLTINGQKMIVTGTGLKPYTGSSYEVGGDLKIGGSTRTRKGGDHKIAGSYIDTEGAYQKPKKGLLGNNYINPLDAAI